MRGVDLVDDMPQPIGAAARVISPGDECPLLLAQATEFGEGCPDRASRRHGIAIGIKQTPLDVGFQQEQCLVLPMQVDNRFTKRGQHADGRWGSVDPGARATLDRDLPSHDELFLRVESGCLETLARRGRQGVEHPFHDGLRRARANGRAIGAVAKKKKGEGVDKHRLAGAGLAGEDVEAWPEFERHVRDGGEIAHAQGRERHSSRSERSPQ